MERLIFRTLPETYAEDLVFSSLRLPDALEPDELADVRQLVHEAVNLAVPKAATCLSQIQDHGDDFVLIDGVRIDCALMAENLRGVFRVFPYVCTCGRELEEWSRALHDPLLQYWADAIKLFYVGAAQRYLFRYIREHYLPSGYLSHMNPGSLPEWPLSQQKILFSILGDAADAIGVELTDSCLMTPTKSTSGILFSSNTHYENCRLCPMPNCPGRRAPYSEK